MNVTAEQWAVAEAERQRQAEMVQTLINEVRQSSDNSQAGCRHFAILLEGTIRVQKHVPWHSCKRSCILISGRSQLVSQIE